MTQGEKADEGAGVAWCYSLKNSKARNVSAHPPRVPEPWPRDRCQATASPKRLVERLQHAAEVHFIVLVAAPIASAGNPDDVFDGNRTDRGVAAVVGVVEVITEKKDVVCGDLHRVRAP